MSQTTHPMHVGSKSRSTDRSLAVRNKYTGEPFAHVSVAGREEVDSAIGAAVAAQPAMGAMSGHARRDALLFVAERLGDRREEFAQTLVKEVGKPIALSRGEVDRAIDTFRSSADEAIRHHGAFLPLDDSARGDGFQAITRRFPIGPCSFITPFNFPLNLAAHKVAPAIAAGCAWVLKPDSRTPLTSLMLGEIVGEAELPDGAFSVLPCPDEGRELFSEDDRLKLLSFTGSPEVGWKLKGAAGRKRVVLELGGNAPCIVDEGTDLERVIDRIAHGSFYQAGQSCISVQRILAHESVYATLRDGLVDAAKRIGERRDPQDEKAILGPLIEESAAERVEQWLREATEAGARALCGGRRDGVWIEPTILENTPHDVRASCQEIFGPVATIEPFTDFEEALRIANDSEWGLQAGVFTTRNDRMMRAFETLEFGGVVINDIPSSRVDSMPYGGVKGSGIGREGPRYAVEDMTELRLLLLSQLGG